MSTVKYIALDFDGTVTKSDSWPSIGEDNPYAISVIKRLRKDGHKIILHTCRQGKLLQDAVDWMKAHGIEPDSVNDNPKARELYGEPGAKMFADYYIDDHSLCKKTADGGVDWKYIKRNYKRIFC